MQRGLRSPLRLAAVLWLGLAALGGCRPVQSLDPATPQGLSISTLFNLTLVLSFLVVALVVGLLGFLIVRFRERPGDGAAEPPQIHGNTRLEVAWTVGPLVAITVLSVHSCRTMFEVERPAAQPLVIRAIGHQWWWEYRYDDLGVVTANDLHVPVGVPVRLEVEAADVVHSFWVPEVGWKMDAINHKRNVLSFHVDRAGVYEGYCTEYCGTEHAWMRIRLFAEPRDRFDAWAAAQASPAPSASAASRGQMLFAQNTCINCHAIRGVAGATAQVGPDLSHFGGRSTIGAGVVDNTPANLREWINNVQGVKPGVLMPAYSFSDEDLAALVDYLEGLK